MILYGSALDGFDGTMLSRRSFVRDYNPFTSDWFITVVFVVSVRLVVSRGTA